MTAFVWIYLTSYRLFFHNCPMDTMLTLNAQMMFSIDNTDNDQLQQEVNTIRAALAAEMERTSQLGAEVARLHASLHEFQVMRGNMLQLRTERDEYKQKLEDQLQFKREPLEARLLEANRVLFEQRLQLRGIVDYLAMQRDWVREWAVLGRENMRLREMMDKRQTGVEVEELRRTLFDLQCKLSENIASVKQYEAVVAVHESKVRSVSLDNDRLVADNNLLREQIKRYLKNQLEVRSAGEKRLSEGGDRAVSKKASRSSGSSSKLVGGAL